MMILTKAIQRFFPNLEEIPEESRCSTIMKERKEEEVEEMPENHFKMVAFHAAIKAVLERQVEKLQLEVNESKRLVDVGQKESEEFAKELHEEQKGLVLEEDIVRNSSKKLEKKQNKRERRELENRNYRVEAEKLDEEIEVKSLQNSSLSSLYPE